VVAVEPPVEEPEEEEEEINPSIDPFPDIMKTLSETAQTAITKFADAIPNTEGILDNWLL
jgi:hypothetical protein